MCYYDGIVNRKRNNILQDDIIEQISDLVGTINEYHEDNKEEYTCMDRDKLKEISRIVDEIKLKYGQMKEEKDLSERKAKDSEFVSINRLKEDNYMAYSRNFEKWVKDAKDNWKSGTERLLNVFDNIYNVKTEIIEKGEQIQIMYKKSGSFIHRNQDNYLQVLMNIEDEFDIGNLHSKEGYKIPQITGKDEELFIKDMNDRKIMFTRRGDKIVPL